MPASALEVVYRDIGTRLPVEHLQIGECIFTRKPIIISTVLGSCVTITFFHSRTKWSGMFHSMLPDSSRARKILKRCNFVDLAVQEILTRYSQKKIPSNELEVKLFGGGYTVNRLTRQPQRRMLDVGSANVDAALTCLNNHDLKPTKKNVLGMSGRKVIFSTVSGQTWVFDIKKSQTIA